jgi:hypothetical protein
MKYIKNFKLFEAVIMPDELQNDTRIESLEQLIEYGEKNGFDVVDYEEFYNSLSDVDKKSVPDKIITPFFALYHPIRKKPMFVVVFFDFLKRIPNYTQLIDDIIMHETIHKKQNINRKIDYILPDTRNIIYFSNKDEVMAFSWSIAKELTRKYKTIKSAMDNLSSIKLYKHIEHHIDRETLKRYHKYIYLYLEKMLETTNENTTIKEPITKPGVTPKRPTPIRRDKPSIKPAPKAELPEMATAMDVINKANLIKKVK